MQPLADCLLSTSVYDTGLPHKGVMSLNICDSRLIEGVRKTWRIIILELSGCVLDKCSLE